MVRFATIMEQCANHISPLVVQVKHQAARELFEICVKEWDVFILEHCGGQHSTTN